MEKEKEEEKKLKIIFSNMTSIELSNLIGSSEFNEKEKKKKEEDNNIKFDGELKNLQFICNLIGIIYVLLIPYINTLNNEIKETQINAIILFTIIYCILTLTIIIIVVEYSYTNKQYISIIISIVFITTLYFLNIVILKKLHNFILLCSIYVNTMLIFIIIIITSMLAITIITSCIQKWKNKN